MMLVIGVGVGNLTFQLEKNLLAARGRGWRCAYGAVGQDDRVTSIARTHAEEDLLILGPLPSFQSTR